MNNIDHLHDSAVNQIQFSKKWLKGSDQFWWLYLHYKVDVNVVKDNFPIGVNQVLEEMLEASLRECN